MYNNYWIKKDFLLNSKQWKGFPFYGNSLLGDYVDYVASLCSPCRMARLRLSPFFNSLNFNKKDIGKINSLKGYTKSSRMKLTCFALYRFGTKVGLGVGVVYATVDQGIWGSSRQAAAAYDRLYDIMPGTKNVSEKVSISVVSRFV